MNYKYNLNININKNLPLIFTIAPGVVAEFFFSESQALSMEYTITFFENDVQKGEVVLKENKLITTGWKTYNGDVICTSNIYLNPSNKKYQSYLEFKLTRTNSVVTEVYRTQINFPTQASPLQLGNGEAPPSVGSDHVSTVIPVGNGPKFMVAVYNTLYVTNMDSNSVSMIDREWEVSSTYDVGTGPNAICMLFTNYSQDSYDIYVANFFSDSVTIISMQGGSTTSPIYISSKSIPVGKYPTAIGASATSGRIYVANYSSSSISVIYNEKVIAELPVGDFPNNIAINDNTYKLYVTNANLGNPGSVSIIEFGIDDTVKATVTVGEYPTAIAINKKTNKIYVTNQISSTVSVINGVTDTVEATVKVDKGPNAIVINETTNKIYVANRISSTVSVINGVIDAVEATVEVGTFTTSVSMSAAEEEIPINNLTQEYTIPNELGPNSIAIDEEINTIYVVSSMGADSNGNVSIIDGYTTKVTNTIPVGEGANAICIINEGSLPSIYISNFFSNNLSVL
ncbi:MAG: YncE family protein [Bacillus sp. (in: firmicutes)]|uniref:YncE family protein n=1 Tax=Bacillus sp. TaxID=1409 RepID=UPI0039E4A9DE